MHPQHVVERMAALDGVPTRSRDQCQDDPLMWLQGDPSVSDFGLISGRDLGASEEIGRGQIMRNWAVISNAKQDSLSGFQLQDLGRYAERRQ